MGLAEEFDVLGFIKGERTRIKSKVFSSKAFGNKENAELNIAGRLVLDVMKVIEKVGKIVGKLVSNCIHRTLSREGTPLASVLQLCDFLCDLERARA